MKAVVEVLMELTIPDFERMTKAMDKGEATFKSNNDTEKINKRLSQLPSVPDEKLR
jgi:hypothetical protein